MATVLEQVRSIAADIFQVPASELNESSSPETIETWDSVQHLNLMLALEQHFNLQFDPDDMDRMKTIGDTSRLLSEMMTTKPPR